MVEIFVGIVVGNLIAEDVTLAGCIALIAQGQISLLTAFLACFIGISLGDLGLYVMGRLAKSTPWIAKLKMVQKSSQFLNGPHQSKMGAAIFISRAIPGTRIPTYLAAGLIEYSFWKFLFLTVTSVAPWVGLVLYGGQALLESFSKNWWVIPLVILLLVVIFRYVLPTLFNRWNRREALLPGPK